MARIKKLKENGSTIYPGTIPQAVVDPTTGKNITEIFASKNVATSSSLGLIKSGSDIVVGGDGSVRVNPMTVTRIHSMGISTAYKLFSINSMEDKGNIIFSIASPVLGGGSGYATYMVYRIYQGANIEKHCYPVCLYATESSMYNRIKLVRTSNQSFDIYYQSKSGNDYCNFILNCATSTDISIVAAGVSSIPEEIYKESIGQNIYLFNDLYVQKDYTKGSPLLKFISPGHIGRSFRLNISNNHLEIIDDNANLSELYAKNFNGNLIGNADTATKATQDENGKNIADTYLPKTGGTMSGALTVESNVFLKSNSTTRYLQIATVNNSGTPFTSRLYVDVNAGRGAFLQFINNGVNYELGVHTDGAPRYIKDNTVYMLYHAGNLVNATTSKAGLMSNTDKSKLDGLSAIARKETDIDSDVFKTPGIYVAPISSIIVDGEETTLYGNSTIITIGNGSQAGYIEQIVIASIDDETKIFRRSWDLTTEPFEFTSLLPDIATSRTAGLIKSGGDITVGGDGTVSVNKTDTIKFNNSSDAINIDNYPQNDYGTITIWYNFSQADGESPGQEGIIYQTKYKSQTGDTVNPYVDCLTQLYVGSGGIKQRTVIDYDAANPFDGIPWS